MSSKYVMMFFTVMALGHLSNSTPMEVSYEDLTVQRKSEQMEALVGTEESSPSNDGGGRSSNLKYVKAIQNSSIWEEVKKRSLTIRTRVDGKIISKAPETLTDEELLQLKQACHDGLKCVAVDQLLVLKRVEVASEDGKKAVKLAITKITKVITAYTTEYHEDTYQYAEVAESDDPSKVYQSVTTIVEDNRELCMIDVPVSSDGKSCSKDDKNDGDSTDTADDDTDPKNRTVNQYNINYGTINTANINVQPNDEKTTDDTDSKPIVRDQSTSTDDDKSSPKPRVIVVRLSPDGSADETTPKNSDPVHGLQNPGAQQCKCADKVAVKTGTESHPPPSPSADSSTSAKKSKPAVAGDKTKNPPNKHFVGVKNEKVDGDTSVGIASAGALNKNSSKKGYVEDGSLNNGNMKVYNVNNGMINKGIVNRSKADGGVISVGTVNTGPNNYGSADTYTNNGTQATMNSYDVQQFATTIDKMYSAILEGLVPQA